MIEEEKGVEENTTSLLVSYPLGLSAPSCGL